MSCDAGIIVTPSRTEFEFVSTAAQLFALPDVFVLESEDKLHDGHLAFETWGMPNRTGDNSILVFSGMSLGSHMASSVADPAPGWWEDAVGPGKPIDTGRYFVICVSMLGSCWGSSGPASIDPAARRGTPRAISGSVWTIRCTSGS